MSTFQHIQTRVRRLLEEQDVKMVFDCPKGEYRFEYFTTIAKDPRTRQPIQQRTYRLTDLQRGTVTPEPWDTFDTEKQARLVAGLVVFSGYRLTRAIAGWTVVCPSCGHIMEGKHWEAVPTICKSSARPKCGRKLDGVPVEEKALDDMSLEYF